MGIIWSLLRSYNYLLKNIFRLLNLIKPKRNFLCKDLIDHPIITLNLVIIVWLLLNPKTRKYSRNHLKTNQNKIIPNFSPNKQEIFTKIYGNFILKTNTTLKTTFKNYNQIPILT